MNLELGKQCFKYSGAKIFNDLPLDIRKETLDTNFSSFERVPEIEQFAVVNFFSAYTIPCKKIFLELFPCTSTLIKSSFFFNSGKSSFYHLFYSSQGFVYTG